jgi:hypothetical protein
MIAELVGQVRAMEQNRSGADGVGYPERADKGVLYSAGGYPSAIPAPYSRTSVRHLRSG